MKRRYAPAVLLCALALPAVADDKPAAKEASPDPAATKLLAEARAARAQWENFPGFRAKLTINIEGRVTKGTVEVSPKGKVTVKANGAKPEDMDWARGELSQVVGHRLGGGAGSDTPCAFLDDNKDHPLGRSLRVLNDEFHSSYRVRDRQILVVNRQMNDSRFTITVMENKLNREKKYLPACYVVNSWDTKTEALTSSASYHHTWKRVGDFDLPASVTVMTAKPGGKPHQPGFAGNLPPGGQSTRSLRLTVHDLLKQ
jgi:hypothetical protein